MPIWRRSASSPTGSSILCCTGSCPIASAARAKQFLFVLGGPNGRRVKELRSINWKGLPCRNVGLSGGGFRAEMLVPRAFFVFWHRRKDRTPSGSKACACLVLLSAVNERIDDGS